MKSIYYLLFLSFYLAQSILPQESFTAIITDPQIGGEKSESFLNSVTTDIKKRNEIENVIVLGNLTANGNYNEFVQIKEVLDGMDKKYFVSGGPNDYLLNGSNWLDIDKLWGENKFHISENGYNIYILNTINKYSNNGNVDAETLNWFKINDEKNKNENLIFSYYPISKINNGYKLTNLFDGEKIISLSSDNNKQQSDKTGTVEIHTRSLSESGKWNYKLISIVNDSLLYYSVTAKDLVPKINSTLSFANLKLISRVDSSDLFLFSKSVKTDWLLESDVTNESGILVNGEILYTANINGLVSCINQNGEEIWEYKTNSTIKTNLLRDKDLVVAASVEGDLFTINSNNGDLVQAIGTGEIISTNIEMTDIIYNDTKTKGIIFGTTAGNVYCYELYSLEMVWDGYISDFEISSIKIANEDKIIIRDSKNKIFCVNSSMGLLIWEWQVNVKNLYPFLVSDVISDGKSIYLADNDGIVHSVDLLLGTENWEKKINSSGKICLGSDRTYLITLNTNNEIIFFSKINGKERNKIEMPPEIEEHKLNFIEAEKEFVYLGYDSGILYRVNNKNEVEKILSMGDSPLISFNKIGNNKLFISNLDGNIVLLTLN